MTERLEVRRAIAASPAEIFSLLTRPDGHVAIDSSGMLMSASGEPVGAVGDTFTVHMDREALNDYPLGLYDVVVAIVKYIPDREIAWTARGQFNLGHVYGYELEPVPEGTLVTSYYDWSSVDQEWKDANVFPVIPESSLRATLGILARTVALLRSCHLATGGRLQMKVISILECRFKPDCIDAGTEWLASALAATRSFDGCLGVDVIQDANDPARLIAVEHWASLEHDRAYRAWREGEGRIEEGGELFESPRKLTVGVVLDGV